MTFGIGPHKNPIFLFFPFFIYCIAVATKIADISLGGTGESLGLASIFRLSAVALSAAFGGALSQFIGIKAVFLLCGAVMLAGSVAAIFMAQKIENSQKNNGFLLIKNNNFYTSYI